MSRRPASAAPHRRGLLAIGVALLAGAAGAAPAITEEVPFITTPDRVTLAMLQLAGTGPADRVLDLGSGDGRIVITAARRFGASGLGVEIDPALVERSQANARQAGVADRARFVQQDLFATDLGQASVITMYLLPEFNLALRPRLLDLAPGTRLVSHDWDMGDWLPDRTLTLEVPEKAIGREKRSRVHLWLVPARVAGRWCGPGGRTLQLAQQYQRVDGQIGRADDLRHAAGRLAGPALTLLAGEVRLHLQAGAGALTVSAIEPMAGERPAAAPTDRDASAWTGWLGLRFQPAPGATAPCPAG